MTIKKKNKLPAILLTIISLLFFTGCTSCDITCPECEECNFHEIDVEEAKEQGVHDGYCSACLELNDEDCLAEIYGGCKGRECSKCPLECESCLNSNSEGYGFEESSKQEEQEEEQTEGQEENYSGKGYGF